MLVLHCREALTCLPLCPKSQSAPPIHALYVLLLHLTAPDPLPCSLQRGTCLSVPYNPSSSLLHPIYTLSGLLLHLIVVFLCLAALCLAASSPKGPPVPVCITRTFPAWALSAFNAYVCTAAFREAVSRLPKSGGVLYVPPGTYLLREAVHIADQPITIRGEGIGVSILAWTEDAGSTGLLITQVRPACSCFGGPWLVGKGYTNTEHPWQGVRQPKLSTASLPTKFLGVRRSASDGRVQVTHHVLQGVRGRDASLTVCAGSTCLKPELFQVSSTLSLPSRVCSSPSFCQHPQLVAPVPWPGCVACPAGGETGAPDRLHARAAPVAVHIQARRWDGCHGRRGGPAGS